jgi:pentatricopeptide repeat protein
MDDVESAKKLLTEDLRATRVVGDANLFNMLIEYFSMKGDSAEMLHWFDYLEEHRISADTNTYNILLSHYVQNKTDELVSSLFNEMKAAGFAPNVGTYTQLIANEVQKGNLRGATNYLEEMKQAGVKSSAELINALGFKKQPSERAEFVKGLQDKVQHGATVESVMTEELRK